MPTEPTPFFQTSETSRTLNKLLASLSIQDSSFGSVPTRHLREIVLAMVNGPQDFDQYCPNNIEWIGQAFIAAAEKYTHTVSESFQEVFVSAYRFLCELEFALPPGRALSFELRGVRSYVADSLGNFSDLHKSRLVYANYLMPASVARNLLNHPDLVAMRDYNQRSESAAALKKQWDEELVIKESRVTTLKSELDNLHSGYNFVGLVKGFFNLAEQKKSEKLVAFVSLLLLGIVIVTPIVMEACFIWNNIDRLNDYRQAIFFALPPLVALEIVLIYFFRVVLVHFRSIKAQLLQLELRIALCQFIESYATYASKTRDKNSSSLEKFENLIFSGLISNDESLPSTFDGTEQLAKLIKSVKTNT